jgi:hypothetical protein
VRQKRLNEGAGPPLTRSVDIETTADGSLSRRYRRHVEPTADKRRASSNSKGVGSPRPGRGRRQRRQFVWGIRHGFVLIDSS